MTLKEQLKEAKEIKQSNVEGRENTGMIATHCLDQHNLEKVLKRDAFICPSIAYTTEENCLCNYEYGSITVIFNEDTINPSKNPNALLISSDGFTSSVIGYDDDLSNEELVEEFREAFTDDEDYMYTTGYDICKSSAAEFITLEQAVQEKNRIVSDREYYDFRKDAMEKYEKFLDKYYPGWWDDNKEKKYVKHTSFTKNNSLVPGVEMGLKVSIKACSEQETLEEKRTAIKSTCEKYGLKTTDRKVDAIIKYAEEQRKAPVVYFEAKLFQAIPIQDIKGIVLPEGTKQYILDQLKEKNIPFSTYMDGIDRKEQVLKFAKGTQRENKINKNKTQER